MTLSFDLLAHVPPSARFIAIDGGGAAGKSTLARLLAATRAPTTVIAVDDFERPRAQRRAQPMPPNANTDLQRLTAILDRLRIGEGRYQRYDWEQDRLGAWVEVVAGSNIILEGVFSTSLDLLDYSDFRIWLDAPAQLRLQRGLARDGEASRSRWLEEWLPTEERYVREEDPRASCDLVLDSSVSGLWRVLRQRQ